MPKKIPKKYVPDSLTKADKKKQIKSIKEKTERPKLDSFKSKRSSWAEKFEKKYGYKINHKILDKGRGAYYNGGSRPNQTAQSWALARLASVIMGGPARKVDKDIWAKYKK